jgi:hypothetical protein
VDPKADTKGRGWQCLYTFHHQFKHLKEQYLEKLTRKKLFQFENAVLANDLPTCCCCCRIPEVRSVSVKVWKRSDELIFGFCVVAESPDHEKLREKYPILTSPAIRLVVTPNFHQPILERES